MRLTGWQGGEHILAPPATPPRHGCELGWRLLFNAFDGVLVTFETGVDGLSLGVSAVDAAGALDGGAVALGLQPPFVGAPAGPGRDARAPRRGDRVPEQGGQPGPGPLAVGELAALLGGGHGEYAAGQPPGQPFGDPVPR